MVQIYLVSYHILSDTLIKLVTVKPLSRFNDKFNFYHRVHPLKNISDILRRNILRRVDIAIFAQSFEHLSRDRLLQLQVLMHLVSLCLGRVVFE